MVRQYSATSADTSKADDPDDAKPAPRGLVGVETGSAFDEGQMFGAYEDGAVFELRDFTPLDVQQMLRRDGKARTIEQVLTLPIMQATWTIEGAKGDKGEADFVRSALTDPANGGGMSTPMDLVIAQAAAAALYRKAFFEKVFKLRRGKVVYDKVAHRPVTTCEVQRNPRTAAFEGFRQYPYRPAGLLVEDIAADDVDWVSIPARRAWVHIHGQHRDPLVGISEMDVPLWCHELKQKLRFLWYAFLETQALPKGIVSHSDVAEARTYAKALNRLKNSSVMAKPSSVTIEPYESEGKGAAEFQSAIRWLDGEMAQSVLAGFTGLTEQATGSYALSKDQSDFFLMSRKAAAKELAAGINAWLVADLVKFNFGADAAYPRFEFGPLSDVSVDTALTTLTTLSGQTSSSLPAEFILSLAEKAAGYLDLDSDKVRAALERAAERAEERAKAGDVQAVATAQSAEAAAQHAMMDGVGKLADKVAEKKRTEAKQKGASGGSANGRARAGAAGVTGTRPAAARPQ